MFHSVSVPTIFNRLHYMIIVLYETVNAMKAIYNEVLSPFPSDLGKVVSKKERSELKLYITTLIYGEIDFESFGSTCNFFDYWNFIIVFCVVGVIIQKIKHKYGLPNVGHSGPSGVLQHRGGYFYDLGSGIGKPVIAAALLHNFEKCIGIETLEGLYTTSLLLQDRYNSVGKPALGRAIDTSNVNHHS
jgi:hypothetical protein